MRTRLQSVCRYVKPLQPLSLDDDRKNDICRKGMNSSSVPPSIPDHELLSPIGRGSYGTVWLARNSMGVFRAIKIVHRDSFSNKRPYERELAGIRRFEPISRSHEGFVDVLHVGINQEQGYFFYVMELGDDQLLGQQIDPKNYHPKTLGTELSQQQKLSFRDCLDLGMALSQALAEMHKHGLVHRDVKPSNIIFVNGIAKLADMGLVADLGEARSYVGTTGFIPPEGPGTPQADVYGLGKVLYEISTGKDRQEFPELPTLLNEFTDSDRDSFLELNEVILRACETDRDKRYQTAWEMHGDLVVLANGQSLKRLRILEKRFANLKRVTPIGVLAVIILALIALQVNRQRKAVAESRLRQDTASGRSAVQSGDYLSALPVFADAVNLNLGDADEKRALRARFGSLLAQCPKLTYVDVEPKAASQGFFDPDGKNILISQDMGEARIYNVRSGKLWQHPFGPGRYLSGATYSIDGLYVMTTSETGLIQIWDVATLTERHRWSLGKAVFNARFSPDGQSIIAACKDGFAWVMDIQSEQVIHKLPHDSLVRFADFSPDGRWLVTGCDDSKARIWDAKTGSLKGQPLEHDGQSWVYWAAFTHDGKQLVTACGDRAVRVWDVDSGLKISPNLIHDDVVTSAVFSPDERTLMTASLDGTVRFWRMDNFKPVDCNPILNLGYRVTSAVYDWEGRRVLTCCADGSVRIWDLAGRLLPQRISNSAFTSDGSHFLQLTNNRIIIHENRPGSMAEVTIVPSFSVSNAEFNANGRFVIVSSGYTAKSANRFVQVFQSGNGQPMASPFLLPDFFSKIAVSDDGRRFVAYGTNAYESNNFAQTWDVLTAKPISPMVSHAGSVAEAFFNPAGNQIVALHDHWVSVWNALDGKDVFHPLQHGELAKHAEYSPDGSRLLTCCADGSYNPGWAQIWNSATGQPIGPRFKHTDGVSYASWSPDGRHIGTASEDFTANIWDIETGKRFVLRHKEKVVSIAFSKDGKWVVTASVDQTARVWNVATGDPLTPPLLHAGTLGGAQFLLGGDRIVTSDRAGNNYIWPISIDSRSGDVLLKFGHLFSPYNDLLSSDAATTSAEAAVLLWNDLETAYPTNFTVSAAEIEAWHEFQAADAKYWNQPYGEAFHLQQLHSIKPIEAPVDPHVTQK